MTTIAALQTGDGWVIASDGQTTSNDRPFTSRHQPKVIVKADYAFAVAGKGSACDVACHRWMLPPSAADGASEEQVYQHMVRLVAPSLRREFDAQGVALGEDESFQMIIAHKGLLFQIEYDFTVLLDDFGMYAIGSGAPYALGAMEAGATPAQAVQIASKFDVWTDQFSAEIREANLNGVV